MMNNIAPPGWNDPPVVTTHETSKPKLLMNKRIPYPLQNSPGGTSPAPKAAANLMPVISTCPQVKSDCNNVAQQLNIEILIKVLDKIEKLIVNTCIENKKSEILKRVDVMKTLWESGKLNEIVHEKVLDLTECLETGDISKANDIYVLLTVNYAILCSSWLIAFKYLIHHCKEL